VREHVPPGVVEALAERVRTRGLLPGGPGSRNAYRVVDAPAAPSEHGYRSAEGPARELRVVADSEATVRAIGLNDVHVWREDERTLRYEVRFGGWLRHAVVVSVGLLLLSVLVTIGLAEASGGALLVGLYFLPGLALAPLRVIEVQRRRARSALEAILLDEMTRLEASTEAARAPAPAPAAAIPEPPPSAPGPRVRVGDPGLPALAATVRTARDAFVRRHELEPEDEVHALERAARKRGD